MNDVSKPPVYGNTTLSLVDCVARGFVVERPEVGRYFMKSAFQAIPAR